MSGPKAPGVVGRRPVLVTGGAGFIGCNIADRLAAQGHDVLVYDALARAGVDTNLDWLRARHPARISSVIADIRDEASIATAAFEASAVFHMAAQVAVTTSLADPARILRSTSAARSTSSRRCGEATDAFR
jgi:CDP-paratose 2-epimerase